MEDVTETFSSKRAVALVLGVLDVNAGRRTIGNVSGHGGGYT